MEVFNTWVSSLEKLVVDGAVMSKVNLVQDHAMTLCLVIGLAYTCLVLNMFGILFVVKRGEAIMGKTATGKIPLWSLTLWWPFHVQNYALVSVVSMWRKWRHRVDYATEVSPGLYLGGLFSDQSLQTADAVIDLTCEFSERIECEEYLCLPVWDGNAPSVRQLNHAVHFVKSYLSEREKKRQKERKAKPPVVLVHCAFGVGRSTTVMCALMVALGLSKDVPEALKTIRKSRNIARLNGKMRRALIEWDVSSSSSRARTSAREKKNLREFFQERWDGETDAMNFSLLVMDTDFAMEQLGDKPRSIFFPHKR